jgi:drug/metabolite transporter (DMT)-like permease
MKSHRSRLSLLLLLAAVLCWADASVASRALLADAEPAAIASSIEGESCPGTQSPSSLD